MNKKFIAALAVVLMVQGSSWAQVSWPAVSSQTRPWTRWWWMGSAVDRDDLRANMEAYRRAGLGGMELTPIYGVKGYEKMFVDYLSPKWMDLFSFTLQEAKTLGLGLDMSTGTGWPFGGGPLIDSVYACKELFYKIYTVHGGETLKDTVSYRQETLIHTDGFPKPSIEQLVEPVFNNKDRQALALDQVRFPVWIPLQTLMAYSASGESVDLTSKVDASGQLQWVAPAGEWTLYALFQGMHGKMVERAAPGAEGNVIDHFSAVALKKYLSRYDTAFRGHEPLGLRSFFNDSYEVDDARGQSNWTPGLFGIFKSHRGYDLREHLPALFGKDTKENNDRVLCDYRETISDLLLEQFTIPWKDWAHSKGAIIRNQAHGAPANILDLYAASDIPETEGTDILRYKFGTSAAHVTGKKLASSESVTWLDEHFTSSLSDVKKALDLYLLGGVNHIFYHGTAYTPMSDPWPGWLFYAAVHFTPNDPSWQNFSTLNEYVARCQSFLQEGAPDNDVLLYYPIYDSWSDRGPALLKHYDRMEPEFRGSAFEECAETMLRRGYSFDYISDKQLQQTAIAGEGSTEIRTSGGSRYQTVLLPANKYISTGAFARLMALAKAGAHILVYQKLPGDVPGFENKERRTDSLHQWEGLLKWAGTSEKGVLKAVIGRGAFFVGDDISRLLAVGGIRREAMVDDSIMYVRRHYGRGTIYFLVNHDNKEWKGYLPLATGFRSAAVFDPMTGKLGLAKRGPTLARSGGHEANDETGAVYLQLLPGESCLVETAPEEDMQAPPFLYTEAAGSPVALQGKWKIEFLEGGPRLPAAVTVDALGSWTVLEEKDVKEFSGTAKYSLSFARPGGKPFGWMLDLGKVNETTQVFLNGKKIAMLIGPYYRVFLPASALLANNRLEVKVSNKMVNRIEDMDRQGIVWKKFYNTNFPAHERANRGTNGLFDAGKWAPVDSGLSGPVTMTPVRRVSSSKER